MEISEIFKLSYKKPEIGDIERDFRSEKASYPKGLSHRNIFRASAKEESFLGIATRVVKSSDCCQGGYRPKRARWFHEWPTSGTRRKNRAEKGEKEGCAEKK